MNEDGATLNSHMPTFGQEKTLLACIAMHTSGRTGAIGVVRSVKRVWSMCILYIKVNLSTTAHAALGCTEKK